MDERDEGHFYCLIHVTLYVRVWDSVYLRVVGTYMYILHCMYYVGLHVCHCLVYITAMKYLHISANAQIGVFRSDQIDVCYRVLQINKVITGTLCIRLAQIVVAL